MAIFWSFGLHVAALALQDLGSGSREFRCDRSGLVSGVYLSRLQAGGVCGDEEVAFDEVTGTSSPRGWAASRSVTNGL